MSNLHEFYNELTSKERLIVDEAFRIFTQFLKEQEIKSAMDDRAEECINSMAKYLIESK